MIEFLNVSKSFKKAQVIKPISISFGPGITGIIGRNGSGKTVLFKMICGLLRPTEGEILVDGKRIGKDIDFPRSLGCIIETPGFLNYESGFRNLMDLASIRHKIGKREVAAALERVGLDPKSRKTVGKYSLGMRQRLGIAQAIMEDPDILILDEPMNGLDEHGVKDVRSILLELKEVGKIILIASHNREDIDVLCDKIYHMRDGEMAEETVQNAMLL